MKALNIVISGTSFWNPGDDFVRDGVIRILKELFAGHILNFHFYNFNQDFFPQSKFSGIANMLGAGDLDQYKEHVDAVVIAGLSAGTEIKDLYNWVISNNLHDRVYLIGAGYENSYVAKYIYEEPEATIFRNAKIIIGRTRKTPDFIHELSLPYHHLNCPALLSVKNVKTVPDGKQIERIGFSIQLPHEIGVLNHSCSEKMYQMAVTILFRMSAKYKVEVIAHHKSEYFLFLKLLKPYGIDVLYSSFYHDLFEIYPRYDLVVTTRLHSSLFANGHGIPGIIINDTDRHTHCLEGFSHSTWVNSIDAFENEFNRLLKEDLHRISFEADAFKKSLLNKYLDVLKEPFGIGGISHGPASVTFKAALLKCLGKTAVKQKVHEVMTKLTPDVYLTNNIKTYEVAIEKGESWFDSVIFLNWFAATYKPAYYLEVGVRRGRSMAQVVTASPYTNCYGFDMWIPDYSGVENPGPDFVIGEMMRLGALQRPNLIMGDSHVTLPAFWNTSGNPDMFELIFIDGDHSYAGAKLDLELAFKHLAPGGALLFDDIAHISHPDLYPLWQEFKARHPEFLFIEDLSGNGTAVAFKPPFDRLNTIMAAPLPNDLPVHFVTIVLNGEPFIRHHIDAFLKLPFEWHWHIIEGVADLKHDTAWSLQNGGHISPEIHNNGLSNDGTTEYIDAIKQKYPERITVYRKPAGYFWDGKLEMVSAPLVHINEECLLWQLDADEIWKPDQFVKAREMFLKEPERTSAWYYCNFYVGPELAIISRDTYGNNSSYEWIRTWHFKPGDAWASHEPPCLCRKSENGQWSDLAKIYPFTHIETEATGLVFDHYAYVLESQLSFKEKYYGYNNAVSSWERLQKVDTFPVRLRDFFPWVTDEAIVTKVEQSAVPSQQPSRILWVRTDSIGDNILSMSMLSHLKTRRPDAEITVLCQEHIAELYETCPEVNNIIPFNRIRALNDDNYRLSILEKLKQLNAEICLNSVYSRELLTDFFVIGSGAPERVAFFGDCCNISADVLVKNNHYYTSLVQADSEHKSELEICKDFLIGLGITVDHLEPALHLTNDDIAFCDYIFEKHHLVPEKTIALFAGTQVRIKSYENYKEALDNICRENGFSVIALGNDADFSINQHNLPKLTSGVYNFSGTTTLRQSAAIISRCRLVVGGDTGLAHIACAVGTPNVILVGGGHFGRFMPYSPLTSVVCLPLECYGCNWECRFSTVHCVRGIAPSVIKSAIRQTLNENSAVPRIFVQDASLWEHDNYAPQWRQDIAKFLGNTNCRIKIVT